MDKFPNEVLKELESHLKEEKVKLEKRLKSLELEDPFADTDRLNDNAASDTDAKEEVDHERIVALKGDLSTSIFSINEALEKIKNGKYGFCESCSKMIDTDRLNVFPAARYCMVCEKTKVPSK